MYLLGDFWGHFTVIRIILLAKFLPLWETK
jgi:hypothetical protein